MTSKIKFNGTGDGEMDKGVHFKGTFNDYTLCGITLDGDYKTAGEFDKTNEKVDCKNCIDILKLCKKVKRSEWI